MFTPTPWQALLTSITLFAAAGYFFDHEESEAAVGRSGSLADCVGCTPEAGAGLANPATPNDPDKDGDSDPADESAPVGTFHASDITEPGTADGSWVLELSGTGSLFESSPGDCIDNDEEHPPCKQETTCSWSVADANQAATDVITVKVTSEDPAEQQTTAPNTSANFTQDEEADPAQYVASFSEHDAPMEPQCNGRSITS